VTLGQGVRARGMGFASRELVSVRIRTRTTLGPTGHGPTITQGTGPARTDNKGRFQDRVNLSLPGYATITFTGMKSHKSASVTVRVLRWFQPWPTHWRGASLDNAAQLQIATADLHSGAVQAAPAAVPAKGMTKVSSTTNDRPAPNRGLITVALCAVALVGSAMVALRVKRQRGNADV
jgi:hypothetical protein